MKVEPPRFADGSDMGYERTSGITCKGDFLSRETVGGAVLEEESSSVPVLLKLSGDVK